MAGLLAWAADVVGGHGGINSQEDDYDNIPLIFSPDQQKYVQELNRKASSLTRLIQDLRLRLPPPDISQRLPHLHAHSLASNAALALQLNSHSATREQAQLREETLQQENIAYEEAILNCENKIQEKVQEADTLLSKLKEKDVHPGGYAVSIALIELLYKEMDDIEKTLKAELENAQTSLDARRSGKSGNSVFESTVSAEEEANIEASKSAMLDKLEKKKKKLSSIEEAVQDLENKWENIQNKALKQPTPAQREKALDKQLHSLIEQLAAKQAQAEGLVGEIHLKEKELERLNGLWTKLERSNAEANAARNRFARGSSDKGSFSDFSVDAHHKLPYYTGGRSENQQRLMILRSAFVLYILALHILVFIKISF